MACRTTRWLVERAKLIVAGGEAVSGVSARGPQTLARQQFFVAFSLLDERERSAWPNVSVSTDR